MNGTLYVVATPIGNLEDITLRAVRILGQVDGIAAEDTRHTLRLLNHLSIHKPLISLHEHNEALRVDLMADKLVRGENWALVSDAGTPGICDPGSVLVSSLRQRGFCCVPIAGASALAAAVSVAGLMDSRFFFEGFLPSRGVMRKRRLEALHNIEDPIFLYEAPHRLQETLQALFNALGDRTLTVFRELTKLHEQVYDTTLAEAANTEDKIRGEYVLLIHPRQKVQQTLSDEIITDHLLGLIEGGMPKKQAVAQTALDLQLRKNRVYKLSVPL